MPYKDSIGQPAGYGSNNTYGPLQAEDMFETVGNPVVDAEAFEMEMGPEMGQIPMQQQMPAQMPMGEMGPEMGQIQEQEMDPMYAADMMRERLRRRQEQLNNASMRFMEVTHELNK
tara:strand:- start:784 stop:1131 length:348 start_codon:yes stop_codon:yes gene_type:complete